MKLGVRAKLFLILLGLIAAAVFVVDVYLTNALDRQLTDRIRDDLLVRAALIAEKAASTQAAVSDRTTWDAIADESGRRAQARVTLVARNGVVLGDSEVETSALVTLENHTSRPEVSAALATGQGWSVRYSTTVRERMMYVAVPFEGGQGLTGVARVAMPLTAVDQAVLQLRKSIALASLFALAVAVVLATIAAQLTSKTLRHLTTVARNMAEGNLHARTRVTGDDEIAALGNALDRLAENLSGTLERLKSERDLLDAVLSGMQEGILVVGHDGRILLVNPSLRETLLLEADCRGKTVLQAIRNADLSALVERAQHASATTVEIEVTGLKPRRLLVKAVRLAGLEGGVVAVFLDVTELRRLEALRRDFVANASHELRTPVAAVRAAAETLRTALHDRDAAMQFTDMIARNAERLQRLIDDLLELSRIESRQFELILEPVLLAPVVHAAVAVHRERAAQRGITFDVEPALESLSVHADRRALELIFGNLFDNAVKYCTYNAQVAIRGSPDGGSIRVAVADTGPGLEPRHLPRLFERFYRVDAGRSRELGGTGLGLAIVKHLVEAMGGAVSVQSAVGAGTTFTITLRTAAPHHLA